MNEEPRQTAPPETGSEAKTALRAKMRAQRLALAPADRERQSAAICKHLFSSDLLTEIRCLFAFWPIDGEVDLRPLIHRLTERGVAVALPRSLSGGQMDFRLFTGEDALETGPYGVMSPSAEAPSPERPAEVILVPAMAVDIQGYRLGYGAGYYDRFLPHSAGITVCPAFAFSVIDHVPREPHDLAVEWIATESGLLRARSS